MGNRAVSGASAIVSAVLIVGGWRSLTVAADPTAPGSPAPASTAAAAAPTAAATAAAEPAPRNDAPQPEEISLRASDGHTFAADFYPQATSAPSPGILLIPDLGGTRKSLAEVAVRLQALGYRPMAMDNSGQMRSVVRGGGGLQTFTPLDSKILPKFVLDVAAAQEALAKQPGVEKAIIAVGYGIGANLALQRAGESDQIGALAMVRPGFGCDEVDVYEFLALLGKRPAILIESQKRSGSDLSRAFYAVSQRHPEYAREQVLIPRAPANEPVPAGHADDIFDSKILDWISRTLPASNPSNPSNH